MKSMYKHWGLHISMDTDCLEVFLGSFWAVWRGLLMSIELKLRLWWFPRYWWFNKQYHCGYQLICLISWPLLISSRYDWYRSKGLLKGFRVPLRPWELSKNWWRYGWMKFVTPWLLVTDSRTVSKAAAWSGLKIALCSSTKVAILSTLYCSACKRGLGILWVHCYCGRGIGKKSARLLPIPTNTLLRSQRP